MAPRITPATSPEQAARWKAVHERAMKRWKLVETAESAQRAQELADLKFSRARLEDQWDAAVIADRRGGPQLDGTILPARPTLVIDKLDQPVGSIINEARRARLAILVKPKGKGANNETAQVLQGLIRAIEVDSGAHAARMWAFSRMVKCGRGYYRIDVEQREDGDADLDIVIKQIANQGSVYLDPFATEPDRRDMKWAFVTGTYQRDEYEDKWGAIDPRLTPSGDLESATDIAPGWVGDAGIRVAEYYEVETVTVDGVRIGEDTFLLMPPPEGYRLPQTVIPTPPPPGAVGDPRRITLRRVMLYVLNGYEILSETLWNGRYIPIIPALGVVHNVDGEWSYQGVITKARDPQVVYNVTVSNAVETSLSQSKSPYIAAFGQVERFKSMWDTMNVRNYPVLYYDPMVEQGTLLPPPQRNDTEPRLMGHAMLIQQADADLKATTGRWEASLGQLNPSDRSGKAIQKLQQQGELGSSHFIDQFASISMSYEGIVLLDMIPVIYDRPGRIVRVLGEETSAPAKEVALNAPFIPTPDGPKVIPPGMPPEALPKGKPFTFDLSKGQYAVVPSVGPSSQTQREDNLAFLQGVIEAVPDVAPNIIDVMMENMDGPLGAKLAARFRAMNPALQGESGEPPSAEEAQAMLQQMRQQMQEMEQALQEAQQAVETQQARQQAALEIAKLRAENERIMAQMKLQAEMAKIRAQITSAEELARFDAAMELARQNDEQAHEARMKQLELDHAAKLAAVGHDEAREARHEAQREQVRADIRRAALPSRSQR